MATLDNVFDPRVGNRYNTDRLRKVMGRNSPIYDFLRRFASNDVTEWRDDFTGRAIDTTNTWAVANGGGAAAASFATTLAAGGWIRATTGTANGDTASASLIGPKIWLGDQNPEILIKFKPITAVTETRIELGLIDVVPGSTKSAVNSLVTPTANTSVADAALYVYDHTGSTTTNGLYTFGTAFTAAKTLFTPKTAIAAATMFTMRLKMVGNQVCLWFDGVLVAEHTVAATDYVEGGTTLAPYAYVRASNATSKSLDLDLMAITMDRV